MPIPFLFIGAAIATGAFGAGKSIKAGVDQKDANDTNERADSMIPATIGETFLYNKKEL